MTKQEFIDKLFKKPCQDALDHFDEFSKDYDLSVPFERVLTDFFLEHEYGAGYYWWCWEYGLPEEFKTDELINKCSLKEPYIALECCPQHLKELDVELFKECALNAPWYTLHYYSNLLDDETFKKCVLKNPWYVFTFCSQRLEGLDEEFLEKLRGLVYPFKIPNVR